MITLYQFETCPFCAKVRSFFDEKGVKYEKINVSSDRSNGVRRELLEKSGVATVPVATFDGKYVGGSDAIIAYVEEHVL